MMTMRKTRQAICTPIVGALPEVGALEAEARGLFAIIIRYYFKQPYKLISRK
jgi:hypothetical protein